jgi:MFS family permease
LTSIGLFELGSLICAVAPNSVALIIGRAIAGLGSAGVFSGAYLIIATSVPLARRPAFNGIIGGVYGVSSVVGPLMGGAFTVNVTWRWCFYINLPIGGAASAVIVFFFNPVTQQNPFAHLTWREKLAEFDLLGNIFFLPSIVCLLIALQWGGSTYPWSNGRIIALLVVFAVCFVMFIAIQIWRPKTATLSPAMLKKRTIWAAALFAFFMGSTFFVIVYYVPIWFQAVTHVSAYESGIRNIPVLLAVVLGTIVSGALVTNIGYFAPFMIASTVITAIGAGLLTTWQVDTSEGKWIGYQILAGFGIGLGLQLPLVAIQTACTPAEVPLATALVMLCQLFGASIFVSAGESVLTQKLVDYIAENIPNVDAYAVASAGATELQNLIPQQFQAGLIEEYNTALTQVFLIALVMACMTIFGSAPMPWNSVKGKNIQGGGGA